jgi:hypothetical protein
MFCRKYEKTYEQEEHSLQHGQEEPNHAKHNEAPTEEN